MHRQFIGNFVTAGSKELHSFLRFAQEPHFAGRKTHYEFSKTI